MNNSINKLLERFISYLDKTESFVSDQAPDFVQQLVAYYSWEVSYSFYFSLVVIICCFILIVIFLLIGFYADRKNQSDLGINSALIVIPLCLVFVVSCSFLPEKYKDLKKLELAPKIFLLERAKELVK